MRTCVRFVCRGVKYEIIRDASGDGLPMARLSVSFWLSKRFWMSLLLQSRVYMLPKPCHHWDTVMKVAYLTWGSRSRASAPSAAADPWLGF